MPAQVGTVARWLSPPCPCPQDLRGGKHVSSQRGARMATRLAGAPCAPSRVAACSRLGGTSGSGGVVATVRARTVA
eukprot:scaffold174518_cov31-Tisochrysis_lutea.AAC.6